jgi:hypothetical protein
MKTDEPRVMHLNDGYALNQTSLEMCCDRATVAIDDMLSSSKRMM